MDWETLYCPNRFCRLYGVPWRQSALVRNGTSRGYKQAICRACGQSVFLRYSSAYFELEAEQAIFDTAIRALSEGNSLRSTARIVQSDKDTACAWLHRAALHCRQVLLYLWQRLPVTECQFG
jgi:transposase-like protein